MITNGEPRQYTAPALEKGLDVLELLATTRNGMTQSAIASQLGKSVGELFRMLSVLEQRGFIYRERPEELYYLSLRMYELAHLHPPTNRLLDVAVPEMRALADKARQSVHLSAQSDGELLILAQVDSPEPAGVTVRVGRRSLMETASGRVLLAFQDPATQARWAGEERIVNAVLKRRLDDISARGFEETEGESLKGIVDISVPLLDVQGHAIAALTVPHLQQRAAQPTPNEVCRMAIEAAGHISARTHGSF